MPPGKVKPKKVSKADKWAQEIRALRKEVREIKDELAKSRDGWVLTEKGRP